MIGSRGIPPKIGGVETHVYNISTRLGQRHEVDVYCRSYYTSKEDLVPNVNLVRLPSLKGKYLDMPVHTVISALACRLKSYDVIHIHGFDPSLFSLSLLPGQVKKVVTVHSQNYLQDDRWPAWARWVSKRAERYVLESGNSVVVLNENMNHYYRNKYDVKTTVIPNGVDVVDTDPVLPQMVQLPYILYVGRLIPSKNVHLLLAALRELNLLSSLVVVGDINTNDSYVRGLLASKTEGVTFTGKLFGDELSALYHYARMVINPSGIEMQSMVALEALSHGVPFVCSDIRANKVVQGYVRYFENGNVKSLIDAISHVLNNELYYRELAKEGKDYVKKYHSWDAVVDGLEVVYSSSF